MEQFSAGDAITAGFRLIRREPVAFLAWAAVYAIVGLAPQFIGIAAGFDAMASLGQGASPEALAEQLGPLQRLQPLSIIGGLVASLLLYGAIYRAMLFPEDRGFLYLRVDARSLWLALSFLAFIVLYVIAIIAIMIPLVVVVGVSAAVSGDGGGGMIVTGLLTGVAMLVGFGLILWGAIRMSLLMPMGFARRAFQIPEAWRLTRGHALRICGVFLAVFVILVLVELLLFGVGAGVLAMFIPLGDLGRLMSSNPMAIFKQVNPVAWIVIAVLWSLLGAWAATMVAAASAEIYRGLSRREGVSEVFA